MFKFLSKFPIVFAGILVVIFLGVPFHTFAATEQINSFDETATVQRDGALIIQENIAYDFGSNQRHGIYRDIPLTVANGPGLNIQVLNVTNSGGVKYPYTTSVKGNNFEIKIGDSNKTVSGQISYLISYKVQNAIRQFSDHQEIYWNATGNDWQIGIQKTSVSVALPDTTLPSVNQSCFTGAQGSKLTDCSYTYVPGTARYTSTKALTAGEGLTFVLGMPVAYLQPVVVTPTQAEGDSSRKKSDNFAIFTAVLLVVIAIFFVALVFITTSRRKPKPVIPKELKRRSVVVEYNPPDGLLPIDLGTILDRRVDSWDISATIISLATRGYLKIKYVVEKRTFWPDSQDYELIKLKEGYDLANPAEKDFFNFLFEKSDTIKLGNLKERSFALAKQLDQFKKSEQKYLTTNGYTDKKALGKALKFGIISSTSFMILFILLWISPNFLDKGSKIGTAIIFVLAAAFVFMSVSMTFFNLLLNKLTPQGLETLSKTLGFREFLQLTEKDKLELLNAPALQPEVFEKFLPYAMVLGVEDKWAKKFEGLYQTAPNWYEDFRMSGFNTVVFLSSINSFNSSFNTAINLSSGTSSGFSGGFSGGGSGGGGGGSW